MCESVAAQYSTGTSDGQLQNTLQQFTFVFRVVNSSFFRIQNSVCKWLSLLEFELCCRKAEYFYLVEPANDKSHYQVYIHCVHMYVVSLYFFCLSVSTHELLLLSWQICAYSVSQKKQPPKTFCNTFTWVMYISVKFCQYVATLYVHILTNFGRFVLIFNKMALILLGVPIVFDVSSFKFY